MRETRILMGMPIAVEIVDPAPHPVALESAIKKVFDYFAYVDETFSTYRPTSEISALNAGRLARKDMSEDMRTVFALSEETKLLTGGYFDIARPDGSCDPSGMVKGWAIRNAARIIAQKGFNNFYVDAGGDIQTSGVNADGKRWSIGIKNPWNEKENVKVIYASGEGVATSGTYLRGEHIYNPKTGKPADDIVSLTVVGPDIYEADRFATAAFAMGRTGIEFIARQRGLQGYMIDKSKTATMTPGFERYAKP